MEIKDKSSITFDNCLFTTTPSKASVKTFNRLLDVIQEQNKLMLKIAEGLRGGDVNKPMVHISQV